MRQDHDQILRDHLLELLKGGHGHATFDKAIEGLPAELRGAKAPGLPHTAWQLVEHLRIAQWDILEFSLDQKHVSPDLPDGLLAGGRGAAGRRGLGEERRVLPQISRP